MFLQPINYIASLFLISMLVLSAPLKAGSERQVENSSSSPLKDTWVVEYEADDFSDEVERATLLFIPQDFSQQAAFLIRCQPFYTNFKVEYVEQKNNLLEDGELPNQSAKFAKHGFIYDTEQELTVKTTDRKEEYDVNIGGQTNYLSKSFKTVEKIKSNQLGMSFFFSFVDQSMPSFRAAKTKSEAKEFFSQLNRALQQQENIAFSLENNEGWQRNFELDSQRMQKFVPTEVMEFCLTKRKIK